MGLTMYCPIVTRKAETMQGFFWLFSPYGPREMRLNWKTDRPYACDNGAWTCHQKGIPFDDDMFLRYLDLRAEDAKWVVVPDKVGCKDSSLEMYHRWSSVLSGLPLMMAAQDGMTPRDVPNNVVGVFLGGTTEYKLSSLKGWGVWAKKQNKLLHVARVNSARRLDLCLAAGATSVDGSGVVRFPKTYRIVMAWLQAQQQQLTLW